MPVLMAESDKTQLRALELEPNVDELVEEVRERLCLKSREKLNAARRSAPYECHSNGAVRRKGAAFVYTPDSAHRSTQQHGRTSGSRYMCRNCMMKYSRCKCSNTSRGADNSSLLVSQLLAEHRLIQEAVRRIHVYHHCSDAASSASLEPPSPCSARSSSTDSMDSSTFSSIELH